MKSVLFDVDGTLLNTREFIVSAFEHTVRSTGRNISRPEAEQYMRLGKNLRATYAYMLPEEDTEQMARRHHEFQMDKFHLIQPFDSAQQILTILRDKGFKIAAVTNRARVSAVPSLQHHGLLELFDACICPEDTSFTKPHPEHILTALRAIDRTPEHAWMVGDTHVDIEASRSAGVCSIGISHDMNRNEIQKSGPNHVVFSLRDIIPVVTSQDLLD